MAEESKDNGGEVAQVDPIDAMSEGELVEAVKCPYSEDGRHDWRMGPVFQRMKGAPSKLAIAGREAQHVKVLHLVHWYCTRCRYMEVGMAGRPQETAPVSLPEHVGWLERDEVPEPPKG